jgi:acetylornithine deacetylase/succinyl-diaminopimelate desuccinylase-like protein
MRPVIRSSSVTIAARRARALFYGHYDVQPVDPLELWEHDPFEPFIETRPDGTRAIRARGASDDKGQLMISSRPAGRGRRSPASCHPGLDHPRGRGGIGGVNLPPFLQAHADELRADIGLICDTSMWDPATPAIQTMLRGLCGEEIVITAADRDLHSGFHGAAAANPNHILARILADLRDADGRVTIPGFYDGVPEPAARCARSGTSCRLTQAAFLGAVGLSVPAESAAAACSR